MRPHVVCIDGMTCPSCELRLEQALRDIPGVRSAEVDHASGIARIETAKGISLKEALIRQVVEREGYRVASGGAPRRTGGKWMEIGASLLVIYALYLALSAFDLASLAPSVAGTLSIGGILAIGLIAGTSSCLAVTGGLLLALTARHAARTGGGSGRFVPVLQFNLGRLASYFLLGGVIGAAGQSLTPSPAATGYLNIAVAVAMAVMGLGMLGLLPRGIGLLRPPKRLSRRIAALTDSDHPAAPLLLGALTFFLPCGFTQSLQIAALGSGSFAAGASIMVLFALGTLPSLLGIGALSTTLRGRPQRLFLRFAGTLVVVLAAVNLQSGLALTGLQPAAGAAGGGALAREENGIQRVSMSVSPYGTYEPDVLTVRAGVPVEWSIDGTNAQGCTGIMTIPSLAISRPLQPGRNVITFTPPARPGRLAFMCSMGMVRGAFNVI